MTGGLEDFYEPSQVCVNAIGDPILVVKRLIFERSILFLPQVSGETTARPILK